MLLGYINDTIEVETPKAIIGIKDDLIGFVSKSDELSIIIEELLSKDYLEFIIKETIDNHVVIRTESVSIKDGYNYFIALNKQLPFPWMLSGSSKHDDTLDLEETLSKGYESMEV